MGEWTGKSIEVDVTNIAHGGVAVARYEGRVVFVSDAIPGERVTARVADDSKTTFWRADTVSVLEPSEHRRPHVWEAASLDRDPADRAGGAEFGHIALSHQRELKRRVLADALSRMAGIDSAVIVEPLPGDEDRSGTGWRTRVRLHLDDAGTPGQYAARSHRVIPVQQLPLAVPEIAAVAPLSERFPGQRHVDLVAPSAGAVRVIVGKHKPSTITEVVGERRFALADTGFWQVHRHAASTLSEAVQAAIDEARFDPDAANLDLYGGVGLLAAAVGDRFGTQVRMTSVESDPSATEFASRNLADWPRASAVAARVETWLRELRDSASPQERSRWGASTVVVDPPRSGLGRPVVEHLAALRPAQVVYVACDPVAFARDVGLFAGRGYALTSLRAFDLFPNTHHVESVGTLSRE